MKEPWECMSGGRGTCTIGEETSHILSAEVDATDPAREAGTRIRFTDAELATEPESLCRSSSSALNFPFFREGRVLTSRCLPFGVPREAKDRVMRREGGVLIGVRFLFKVSRGAGSSGGAVSDFGEPSSSSFAACVEIASEGSGGAPAAS